MLDDPFHGGAAGVGLFSTWPLDVAFGGDRINKSMVIGASVLWAWARLPQRRGRADVGRSSVSRLCAGF